MLHKTCLLHWHLGTSNKFTDMCLVLYFTSEQGPQAFIVGSYTPNDTKSRRKKIPTETSKEMKKGAVWGWSFECTTGLVSSRIRIQALKEPDFSPFFWCQTHLIHTPFVPPGNTHHLGPVVSAGVYIFYQHIMTATIYTSGNTSRAKISMDMGRNWVLPDWMIQKRTKIPSPQGLTF